MDLKNKEIIKTLQVLLWIWFGTITSFAIVNTVNIAKLEIDSKAVHEQLNNLDKRILLLKYHYTSK
jgi:hypothetical protein